MYVEGLTDMREALGLFVCVRVCISTYICMYTYGHAVLLSYGFNSYRLRVNKLELELDMYVYIRTCGSPWA